MLSHLLISFSAGLGIGLGLERAGLGLSLVTAGFDYIATLLFARTLTGSFDQLRSDDCYFLAYSRLAQYMVKFSLSTAGASL